MIHATISGLLTDDATFTQANGSFVARARFRLSTRHHNPDVPDQLIDCTFYGKGASAIHKHLVAGKRIIATGELRLPEGQFPRLIARAIELVGGSPSYQERRNAEQRNHDEDDDHAL